MMDKIKNQEGTYAGINKNNANYLLEFDKENIEAGLSDASRYNYNSTISMLLRFLGKTDLNEASQKNISDFLETNFNNCLKKRTDKKMPATLHIYKSKICFFTKWLNNHLNQIDEYPDYVMHLKKQKIRGRKIKNEMQIIKLNPEHILNAQEVLDIVKCTESTRGKCLIYLIFNTGARINEVLHIRKKDIEFNERYCKIKIRAEYSKSKIDREVFISRAMPILRQWIEEYSLWQTEENPFLFVDRKYRHRGRPITSGTARLILKAGARNAHANGLISKEKLDHITLHGLRHSKITESSLANMPISVANKIYGWKSKSLLYLHYTNLTSQVVEDYYKKETLGITKEKENKLMPTNQQCPQCSKTWGLETKFCSCGWTFDGEEAEKVKSMQDQIDELREIIENNVLKEKVVLSDKDFDEKRRHFAKKRLQEIKR